jgi:hypothetical protein
MDQNLPMPHTPAWESFTVVSFMVATLMLGTGIWFLPTDWWVKGYFAMAGLFTIGATANVTKTLRDKAEYRHRRGEVQHQG